MTGKEDTEALPVSSMAKSQAEMLALPQGLEARRSQMSDRMDADLHLTTQRSRKGKHVTGLSSRGKGIKEAKIKSAFGDMLKRRVTLRLNQMPDIKEEMD